MNYVIMKYSQYKKHYSDCETTAGTYDKINKTIEVAIPDGRMKASGVRGRQFRTYWIYVGETKETVFKQGFRAVSAQNAIKQAKAQYKYVVEE